MSQYDKFKQECAEEIAAQGADTITADLSRQWMDRANQGKYSYHFEWMGRPIIQYPQDIMAMQEIIWQVQPDLIVETGIAHGGSLIFSASMLELNAACGGPQDGHVIGLDIEIRSHNRAAVTAHPMSRRITMIEGSSIEPEIIKQVYELARDKKRILVCLDSNHTHDHVLAELEAYADLTSPGSYCVVFDTVIEDMPADSFPNRPWGKGNNPKSAIHAWLPNHPDFSVDLSVENKLLVTVAPGGFLKRTV